MKTLYEQIKYALQEDIDNNELLSLTNRIKESLNTLSIYIGLAVGGSKSYKAQFVDKSCKDLATSLSLIIEKLVELENRIEELDNRGM